MVVLVLTACPAGLRGHLTRWMLEISPGVFVGGLPKRVRELMWARVVELSQDGRAIMVYSAPGEQKLDFRVYRHTWVPEDVDGVMLMRRPQGARDVTAPRPGWSTASRVRRARRKSK